MIDKTDLAEAFDRLNQRKLSAGAGYFAAGETIAASDAVGRGMFVGLDLNTAELGDTADGIAVQTMMAMLNGAPYPLRHMLASVWVDGLVIGLLVAEVRREREQADA